MTKIICACREVGIFFFKIIDGELINTSVIYEISAEQPLLSADEKLLYVANGFQGLFIINVADFDNPFKIS